jgi:basic membrane protein A and related proteins
MKTFLTKKVSVFLTIVFTITLLISCNFFGNQDDFGFSEDPDKLNIGFITVGPISDWGFNYSFNQARLYLDAEFGDKIKTTLVENVPEGADVERVMQRMINSGADLLFPTSFGYMDPGLRVAARNPETIIMHTGGYKVSENFGTYTAYLDEAFYLSGIVAGHMTQSNKIGFVAAHPIPPIVREINALILGAQTVNPDIEVIVVWTGGWSDPAKETEAANALIDRGCDVLASHQDSPMAVVRTAERRNAFSIGCHADLSQFAPSGWLTGAEWNWGPFLKEIVNSVLNETWEPDMLRGGIQKNYVKLSPFGEKVPIVIQDIVLQTKDMIIEGQMHIFQGPIYNTDSELVIKENEKASFEQIEGMNWFVKGVRGSLR